MRGIFQNVQRALNVVHCTNLKRCTLYMVEFAQNVARALIA